MKITQNSINGIMRVFTLNQLKPGKKFQYIYAFRLKEQRNKK